jgi:hypothetical protein
VKFDGLVAVPPGVVTAIGPVLAPLGTVAVIFPAEFTVNVVALVPLNLTALAFLKFVPVIVTDAPTLPLRGEKPEIVGAGMTVKLLGLVAVPAGVVTLIGPVVAPSGTTAVILVDEFTVDVALMPLKVTPIGVPVKRVPVIVTKVPTPPLVGVKPVTVGGGAGVTGLDGSDAGPVPFALVAVTVNVYGVPFVRPVTVQLNGPDVQVQVRPPGDAVAL